MKFRFLTGLVALALGGSAAQAIMIDDGVTGSKTSITYAKETLPDDTTDASDTADNTSYYEVMRSHTFTAPVDIPKTRADDSERYTVVFSLSGMVFGDTAPTLVAAAGVDAADGDATFTAAFGAKGDNFVLFRAGDDDEVGRDDVLTLTAYFSVSEEGGSISRTVTNANLNLAGAPESGWKRTRSLPNAIKVISALKETVTPMNAEAKATHDFMAFGGSAENPTLTEDLGSVLIGVVTPNLLHAQRAGDDDLAGVEVDDQNGADDLWHDVRSLFEIIAPKGDRGVTLNPVMFSGDVSFASKVALREAATCTGLSGATDLREPSEDDPKVLTDTLMKKDANDFISAMHLCLMVDGETPILPGAYSVETMYKPVSSAYAFAASGSSHALGSITRDGITVHIPYFTTYGGYNQRLLLRNRSGREVTYTITFATEEGIVAVPSSHSGTLAALSVETMRIQDIVELIGGKRTAATFTSNAAMGTLGVATTLVNIKDGNTDTETHLQ